MYADIASASRTAHPGCLEIMSMTFCASTFSGIVSHHALAGSLRLDSKAALIASAQKGVSSLPLHAQITACSLHSGSEGGPQKQIPSLLASFIG